MGEAWVNVVKAEGSAEGVQVSRTLWVPRRVDALVALAGEPGGIEVRAELRGDRPFVAVLTRLSINLGGEPIPPAALSVLSQELAKTAVAVLAAASLASNPGQEPAKALAKALRVESRRAAAVSPDREDALLIAWEAEYQPKGYSQAHMADMEGIKVSTLMTYLSRARKRRKPDA